MGTQNAGRLDERGGRGHQPGIPRDRVGLWGGPWRMAALQALANIDRFACGMAMYALNRPGFVYRRS